MDEISVEIINQSLIPLPIFNMSYEEVFSTLTEHNIGLFGVTLSRLSHIDPLLGHDCVAADRETPISRNDFRYELRTGAFRARTDSRFQKQALLDLPRPSRDREEGLDG